MKQNDVERLREEALQYHEKFRHPRLSALDLSAPYYLCDPPSEMTAECKRWDDEWPNAHFPGVYAFFNDQGEVVYIGKSVNLGGRLSSYFKYGPSREAQPIGDWGSLGPPTTLVTIAVSERFEAPGLEEYLIAKLNPPGNKIFNWK
jgi:hypothetical protein